jgi:hypothetical protein
MMNRGISEEPNGCLADLCNTNQIRQSLPMPWVRNRLSSLNERCVWLRDSKRRTNLYFGTRTVLRRFGEYRTHG